MTLTAGFTYLKDIDCSILVDLRYYTTENFIGRRIRGYESSNCIMTLAAANALSSVQRNLSSHRLSLLVYDAYRPQCAVDEFIAWSLDEKDQAQKSTYYPNIDKHELFNRHYLAKRSAHSRGSTVDITLVNIDSHEPLDMGSAFDFLDPLSHPLTGNVSENAKHNRLYLREIMSDAGFTPITTEWWHFTLKNEPFPNTYFDFPIR